MAPIIEASGAMHLVDEIPAEDENKLRCMSRVFLRGGMDIFDMTEFAMNAYKIGRETEARRHQCFVLGSLEDVEKISILRALEATGFNPVKAAYVLKIGKTTMYRKLKYFGIDLKKSEEVVNE
jgi:transcriptional regulator of acetoin/glycerol metabolism